MEVGLLIDIVVGNIFRKNVSLIGGLGPKSRHFLIYQPIAINLEPIMMTLWFFMLLKMCTEMTKNSKHQLEIHILHYTAILPK